jgi:hypothetical protein
MLVALYFFSAAELKQQEVVHGWPQQLQSFE